MLQFTVTKFIGRQAVLLQSKFLLQNTAQLAEV